MANKNVTRDELGLIKTLIDMFSNSNIELKRVVKELRKRFDLTISLNQLSKIKEAMDRDRKESITKEKEK
tara:strand:- start:52435 stop:52644 length:210 start_codon:yes stop_codon:yes gene_type:complete